MELEAIVKAEFRAAASALSDLRADPTIPGQLAEAAERCIAAVRAGGKVVFAGNGGSFAQAQHLAAELVGRFRFDRDPIGSLTLGGNGASLTAISNDYEYQEAFLREASVLLTAADFLVVLTTSGNSPNVVEVARRHAAAGGQGMAWTGASGGAIAGVCPTIQVPAADTARIQESHLVLGHTLCHLIETGMAA